MVSHLYRDNAPATGGASISIGGVNFGVIDLSLFDSRFPRVFVLKSIVKKFLPVYAKFSCPLVFVSLRFLRNLRVGIFEGSDRDFHEAASVLPRPMSFRSNEFSYCCRF